MDWDDMAKGLVGVGVLLAEVEIFLNNAKFNGKAVLTATGIVILARAPPIATRPLAISSQLMLPIEERALATILSAAPTTTRPAPTLTMFLGIRFTAIATSARAPPIAIRPFAITERWPVLLRYLWPLER